MDINDLRTLATVLVAVAFTGIVWWAFGPSRKKYFEEAAQLPFTDESPEEETRQSVLQDNNTPENDDTDQPTTDDKQKGDQP